MNIAAIQIGSGRSSTWTKIRELTHIRTFTVVGYLFLRHWRTLIFLGIRFIIYMESERHGQTLRLCQRHSSTYVQCVLHNKKRLVDSQLIYGWYNSMVLRLIVIVVAVVVGGGGFHDGHTVAVCANCRLCQCSVEFYAYKGTIICCWYVCGKWKWCEGNKEIEELVLHNWYRVSYRSGNIATTYKRFICRSSRLFSKENRNNSQRNSRWVCISKFWEVSRDRIQRYCVSSLCWPVVASQQS